MADKIEKLSQAIRLGATFRPQGYGSLFTSLTVDVEIERSCALGAAYEAVFGLPEKNHGYNLTGKLTVRFPELNDCLVRQIERWNDIQNRSREWIADELEKLGY